MSNADADLNADASKINEDYENMNISMEEEQDTVKCQKLGRWMSKISP